MCNTFFTTFRKFFRGELPASFQKTERKLAEFYRATLWLIPGWLDLGRQMVRGGKSAGEFWRELLRDACADGSSPDEASSQGSGHAAWDPQKSGAQGMDKPYR